MGLTTRHRAPSPLVAVVALVFVAALGALPRPVGAATLIDGVLLRVNDRIVTMVDYQLRLAATREQISRAENLSAEERAERLRELPRLVMRDIFQELLLLSRADQLRMAVSDLDLDEMVRNQMERYGITTPEEFSEALAQNGMSFEGFRTNLRNQRLQGEVVGRELWSRVQLEEDELRRVYKERQDDYRTPEYRTVREIVVLDESAASPEEARRTAEKIAQAWRDGAEPKDLAAQHGGLFVDIGRVLGSDLARDLRDVAWALELSDVSDPVAARGGWHVLQVVLIEPSVVPPFEEIREQLARAERGRRVEEEQDDYLEELEKNAYFKPAETLPPELEGFRTATGRSLSEGGLQLIEGLGELDDGDPLRGETAVPPATGDAEAESAAEPPAR